MFVFAPEALFVAGFSPVPVEEAAELAGFVLVVEVAELAGFVFVAEVAELAGFVFVGLAFLALAAESSFFAWDVWVRAGIDLPLESTTLQTGLLSIKSGNVLEFG